MNSPSIIKAIPNYVNGEKVLKKVVGYARVSTEEEKQDTSYNLQISQLEKDIKSNPNYQFLGIFKDKGTGRSYKGRGEFKLMLELARANEIDVIITKSISRFGRNLVDTISLIRELRNIGVEIFFQKENISSLDDSFDFLLTMLSAHAEEESKNISDNNNWSIRKRKQRGANFTTVLYGYRIVTNEYIIHEDEARVIRDIFDQYIKGSTIKGIIFYLHKQKIKSPTGKEYWGRTTLEHTLTNEKYCGDMLLGRRSQNVNSAEMAHVKHNHKGIISRKTFEQAQKIRKERRLKHPGCCGKTSSPYSSWLYSSTHEKHLRYKLEQPKGRSGNNKTQIPTLYCDGNHKSKKRVSFQVGVIIDLLDQIINDFKSKFLIDTKTLVEDKPIQKYADDYNLQPLIHGHKYEQRLLSLKEIRKILISGKQLQIEDYRKIFQKIIIGDGIIEIKISLFADNNASLERYRLIHQTNFTYLKLFKPITLSVSVYLETLD